MLPTNAIQIKSHNSMDDDCNTLCQGYMHAENTIELTSNQRQRALSDTQSRLFLQLAKDLIGCQIVAHIQYY